jgi:hypothetical protein
LKKANQKRLLGAVAIEEGNFTTAFFKKDNLSDIFGTSIVQDDLTSASPKHRTISKKDLEQVGIFVATHAVGQGGQGTLQILENDKNQKISLKTGKSFES